MLRFNSLLALVALLLVGTGCRSESANDSVGQADSAEDPTPNQAATDQAGADETAAADEIAPQTYEVSAEKLLAARLPTKVAADGWLRLFDGHTLFGWQITGDANWRVVDNTITVNAGEPCLLCTSTAWHDYELTLEFKAAAETNSGVFLRTPLQPSDPSMDCYEVNIASDNDPFPTGSLVQRQRVDADAAPKQAHDTWRQMSVRLKGDQLQVSLDGKLVCDYTDPTPLIAGRIGLQYNDGAIAFRNIRLRPLGLESLLDKDLSQWKRYPEMPGEFTVTDEGWLRVHGGKMQLESKQQFADFTLLAEYIMEEPEMNSGIFFRSIPGAEMMGYECQISNEMIDGNPLRPADAGTGGIFRRQDARIVAGEAGEWATVVLAARGPSFAAWVNGIQVSDVTDTRAPDENPRRGLRLEPGTLMVQGHDANTDALYKQLKIVPFPSVDQP